MGATQSQGGPVEFPGVADWSQLAGIISIGFDSATGQLKFETGGMAVGAEVRSEVGSLRTYAITARFPRQPAPLVLLLPEAGAESVAPPVQLRVAAERVLEGVHPEDFQRLVGRRGSAGGGGAAARLVWRPVGGLGSTRGWQRIGVVTSLRSCGDNVLLISARLHFKGSLGVAAERQAARRTASHTLHLTLTVGGHHSHCAQLARCLHFLPRLPLGAFVLPGSTQSPLPTQLCIACLTPLTVPPALEGTRAATAQAAACLVASHS